MTKLKISTSVSVYKQGRKRPLDTPEGKIEKRERETVMTETQRNMIERARERESEREKIERKRKFLF